MNINLNYLCLLYTTFIFNNHSFLFTRKIVPYQPDLVLYVSSDFEKILKPWIPSHQEYCVIF